MRGILDNEDSILWRFLGLSAALSLLFALGLIRLVSAGEEAALRGGAVRAQPGEAVGQELTPAGQPPPTTAARGGGAFSAGPGRERSSSDSARAGVSSGRITVGTIFSESGGLDGKPWEHAVRAYFNYVNEMGGIHGRTIELIAYDDGTDATRGDQLAKRLVEQDRVFAIVGMTAPMTEPRAVPYFVSQGVPVIGGVGVPSSTRYDLSFPTLANLRRYEGAYVWVAVRLGVRKPAVVVVNVPWGEEMREAVVANFRHAGIEPVDEVMVDVTQPDYTPLVLKWRAMGADSVFAPLDPMSYVRLLQAMGRQGWRVPVFGGGMAVEQVEKGAGPELLEGVVSSESHLAPSVHPNAPGVRLYVETVKRYYPGDPLGAWMEVAWAAARVFVEGLRLAGPDPTREKLVAALNSLTRFDVGVSVPITYRPGPKDPINCIDPLLFRAGKWQSLFDRWFCWKYDDARDRAETYFGDPLPG